MTADNLDFLQELERVIRVHAANPSKDSYTARLAATGPKRVAQKVGEEGVELALASVDGTDDEVLSEAADLLYHVLVLLRMRGLSLSDVVRKLETRHTG